jgi:protease-4
MDSGIKGRATSAYLRGLVRDPRVAAVVLRADSPGGDPLPSDLVADAVRKLKAAGKPVIVSQGDVAASGGYWISMDGTRVLTTPLTVTGSIGVIGGWIWDDGFADKLGVSSDAVSRGAHADLFTTVNLPFLGGIPRRAMNDDELARTKAAILDNYGKFVQAVARGRGLDEATVRGIAEGRVWMGGDAVERGLCDGYGTLDDAIRAAREAAALPTWREVRVVEYPPRPLIEWPSLLPELPSFFGLGDRVNGWLAAIGGWTPAEAAAPDAALRVGAPGLGDLDVEYLRQVSAAPGRPLAIVPGDVLPEAWRQVD